MTKFPLVDSFMIPELGWRCVDKRRLSNADLAEVQNLWTKHVVALMDRNGALRRNMICGMDFGKTASDMTKFREARTARPELGWKQFEEEGGTVSREWDCDPRLPELFFAVRDRDGWLGGIPISNINVEAERDKVFRISGFFLLGVPEAPGKDIPETWVEVFKVLLRKTLTTRDDYSINIVQYNLLSSAGMRRTMNDNPEIKKFLGLMRELFERSGDPENIREAVRFRRKPPFPF